MHFVQISCLIDDKKYLHIFFCFLCEVLKQVQSIEQPKERLNIEMALVYDEYMYKYMEKVMQAKTYLQKLQYIITTWNTVSFSATLLIFCTTLELSKNCFPRINY